MNGYKLVTIDYCSIAATPYTFLPGQSYTHDGEPHAGHDGFHFCESPIDLLPSMQAGKFRCLQIRATGVVDSYSDERSTNKIEIVKELTMDEFLDKCTGVFPRDGGIVHYDRGTRIRFEELH